MSEKQKRYKLIYQLSCVEKPTDCGTFAADLTTTSLLLEDTFRHKGLRRKLVEEIRDKGIHDESVLAAIGKIPRHLFMDNSFVQFAYVDKAFPIAAGQTISQPYTVAFQTEALSVKRFEKVLEVGTGSGYQAAILCELGVTLYTIERQRSLFDFASTLLPGLGYYPHFFFGDGYAGLPTYGPFDKIIVTAAAPFVPAALKEQLAPGGKMIIPVGERAFQVMKLIVKTEDGLFHEEDCGHFIFVPMVKGVENESNKKT